MCVRARTCVLCFYRWPGALHSSKRSLIVQAVYMHLSARACRALSHEFASHGLYVPPEQDYDAAMGGTTQAAGAGGGNLGMEMETERDGPNSQTQQAPPDALPLELGDSAGHTAGSGSGTAVPVRCGSTGTTTMNPLR